MGKVNTLYNMDTITIDLFGLCLALNAVALFLQGKAIRDMSKELDYVKTVAKANYLNSLFLYEAELTKLKFAAIEREDYETAQRINDILRRAEKERDEITDK